LKLVDFFFYLITFNFLHNFLSINFASEKDPQFKSMIELLVDGNSRRQVAEQMGLPKSTVIDRVTKLRKLWDEFADNICY